MSRAAPRTPHEIIDDEREAYWEALPPPDPDWPPDVRLMYEDLHDHLFDVGLTIREVKERLGLGNNNIASRFKYFVGQAPKRYVVYHCMELARRLLQREELSVAQGALAVGYASPNGFSMTFKRWEGVTPTTFRKKVLKRDGM